MSGQMQRLIESAEIEKTQFDERLKQDMQHLMIRVHQKFVEVDTAVATISSMQTANSQTASQSAPQAAPQLVPQTAPSATAQPSRLPRQHRHECGTQARKEECRPHSVKHRELHHKRAETPRKYSVDPKRWTDHRKLDLDMKPKGFVAWRDRAFGYLAAERTDIRKLLLWAESQNPTIGTTE